MPNVVETPHGLCISRQIGYGKSWEEGGMFNGEGHTWTVWENYKEVLFPIFNSKIIPPEIIEKIRSYKDGCTLEGAIENNFSPYIMVMGQNAGEGAAFCSNYEKDKENAETEHERNIASKQTPIKCWEGRMGLRFERLPRNVWSIIQPFGKHWTKQEAEDWIEDCGSPLTDDVSDIIGWNYEEKALNALWAKGFSTEIFGTILSDQPSFDAAKAAKEEREKEIVKLTKERDGYIHAVKAALIILKTNMLVATPEQCQEARQGEKKLFSLAGIDGHNIYGSGAYIKELSDTAYYIQNNGMDGDDWSRNNYDTGGAGAICYKMQWDDYEFFKAAYEIADEKDNLLISKIIKQ